MKDNKQMGLDWGLGIGDWGLGQSPIPQSPIPNPQSPQIAIKLKLHAIYNISRQLQKIIYFVIFGEINNNFK
jgi:hypothetical protein